VPASDELLDLAVRAATDASQLLLGALHVARATVSTKTSLTDMVTEMDHASEALLRERLLGARPQDGFLGEETGETAGTSGVRWVCDPLDGTTNYLYAHPGFNVSVAAEDDDGVVAAVVVDPLQSDVFTATRGGGARRNGAVIACSAKGADDLGTALCATGFAYDADRRRRQAEVLVRVLPQVRDVRRMGAAAIDLCSVAAGRVDAYWERGLAWWDHAAGGLVAAEAGATVGYDTDLGFTLAAPPGLFGPLHDLLLDAGAATA
jgi:myo-inositol-1(or 4)-monophosphatase